VGSTQHKPFDPVRAPIIKEIFEKYATGDWSMPDLAKWSNEQGLKNFAKRRPRTKAEVLSENSVMLEKVEKPIVPNNIYYILGSKFYTGLMLNSRNQWIPSLSHEPLIDQDLFDKVQKMRNKKQVSIRYKKAIGHALRGFVRCADCGRVYTPYMKKGIQYFSSRCIDGCQNGRKSCNLAFIEKELASICRIYS
jgi:site-specific DNA recombinase